MVSTTKLGCFPVAVSPLSITASAPSSTALATSVISLRLGLIRSIMLSIICVATITGLARCRHLRIDLFLDKRNLFDRKFNTKVAACNHDTIGFKNDVADIGKCFGLFYLGNDLRLAVLFGELFCGGQRCPSPSYK